MRGIRILFVMVICALLGGCYGLQAPADTTADATSLDGFAPAWEKAYNSGDAAAVVALYADDATLNAPGTPSTWEVRDDLSQTRRKMADGGGYLEFGQSADATARTGSEAEERLERLERL